MPEPLEPEGIFRVLARRGVDYVLIGGLAAVLHGSSALTNDADVCPDPAIENLDRLAGALQDMNARIRTHSEPEGLPFACDAPFLSRMKMVDLTTRFGDIDISYEPAGIKGYHDLAARAVVFDVDGIQVKVAALADIIRSKETANRDKDRATLPILYALQDEIAKQERGR